MSRTYDVGAFLLDCACESLAATEGGCPERRCLVAGISTEVEQVNCCPGGQLTVNLVREYPSRNFPEQNIVVPQNCPTPYTVAEYSVQVYRCHPVGTPERAPDCDALDDAARLTWSDMDAVRKGVACCLRDEEKAMPVVGASYRWLLGEHVTVGPEGGCAGSALQVLVGIPACWGCP